MPFRPLLRSLALPFAAGLLCLGLACKGKKHEDPSTPAATTVQLSGKVTYDRIPVVRGTDGKPLGLETDPTKFQTNLPARSVKVVLYEKFTITENSTTKEFYRIPTDGEIYTKNDGTYSFQVTPGTEYMVEVQSTVFVGSASAVVNVTADPAGLASTVPVLNRLRYCYRKDLAGNLPPTGAGVNHVASSSIQSATTLDIHLGVNDTWFLADTDIVHNLALPTARVVPTYSPGSSLYAYAGDAESTASGSKILGILDSIAAFAYSEGIDGLFFPITRSVPLDLNYVSGLADPRGSRIEFNRNSYPLVPGPTQQSAALDPFTSAIHYLGTLSGAPDAAWDEGLILTLMARCSLFTQLPLSTLYGRDTANAPIDPPFPIAADLPNLHPDLALTEGLPELMAALIQQNPYLGLAGKDIRDLSALQPSDKTIYAAPLVRALGWEAALLEHGIVSPGTPTDWAKLKINNMRPFFTLSAPTNTADSFNLYAQLKALATSGTTNAGVTPSTIFTDAAIQNLLASAPLSVPAGNIPWPRPASGPLANLGLEWGLNPTGALPDFTLSMSKATLLNGLYPNLSQGELVFAHLLQSGVKRYQLNVALLDGTNPTTLTGGQIEVTFISPGSPSGTVIQSFLFDGSSTTVPLLLEGTPGVDAGHYARIRMLSPTTLQPDTTVRITLTPES